MVAVGKIGGLFGSDGGLSLTLFDDFPTEVNIEEPVFVKIDEHTVPLFFDDFRRRGQRGATVRFADIDTTQRAEELVGLELRMPLDARDADGELGSAEDFVGWFADFGMDLSGEIVGFVDGANPLFEVEIANGENSAGRTVYIPAVDEFVVELDEPRRRIIFALPEGLLELND